MVALVLLSGEFLALKGPYQAIFDNSSRSINNNLLGYSRKNKPPTPTEGTLILLLSRFLEGFDSFSLYYIS